MKRWHLILVLILAAGAGVGGYFLLVWWSADGEEPQLPAGDVNAHARLAASGSPLPSPAWEDVTVEQQQFDGRVFYLSYDQETGNWQLDWHEDGTQQSLRYLVKEDTFLYFNPFDWVWDEVDQGWLHSDFRELKEIDQFLLTLDQLDAFNALAFEEESLVCSQDKSAVCAVWQAKNFQDDLETRIYVNKRTRKIDQVVTVSPRATEAALVTTYTYQPVEISWPNKDEVRYLPEDI